MSSFFLNGAPTSCNSDGGGTVGESGVRSSTIVIAAANSSDKSKASADFVCVGTNDQDVINEAISTLPFVVVHKGNVSSVGTNTQLFLASDAYDIDFYYNGMTVRIVAGTGAGQINRAISYSPNTKRISVVTPWTVLPDTTSQYEIGYNGGSVTLLEGVYDISGSITLLSGLTLEGMGSSTILRASKNLGADLYMLSKQDDYYGLNGLTSIRNITFDGNRTNNTVIVRAIDIGATSRNILVENNVFVKFNDVAIHLGSVSYSAIKSNKFVGNEAAFNGGLSYSEVINNQVSFSANDAFTVAGSNNIIQGNHFVSNFKSVLICSGTDLSIVGNRIQTSGGIGMNIATMTGGVCAMNVFVDSGLIDAVTAHLELGANVKNSSIQGNTFRGTSKCAYAIENLGQNNLITNNVIVPTAFKTAAINDIGTGTVTTAGNKIT